MLNITRLLCGSPTLGDGLRYGEPVVLPGAPRAQPSIHQRPVVVWNITRRCNLRCVHCYTASTDREAPDELTTAEARAVIDDLARFSIPVLLFSGGEPLLHQDLLELVTHAHSSGIRPVLSSNGTLLTREMAMRLKRAGLAAAGISVDGDLETNDQFRGKPGAFQEAVQGIRHARDAGLRVSLRFTMTRYNVDDLDAIFALVEQERIPRLCVYHLAYAGRGRGLLPVDLMPEQRRQAVERIFKHTIDFHQRGLETDVLTVDNHADAAYLLLWAQQRYPDRVAEAHDLLRRNGGNSAGKGIACIDERGFVHPDQFWRTCFLGNVRERPFSQIWSDEENEFLGQLHNRQSLLQGRCPRCRFLDICNGNLRARGDAATGDPWGEDPACYLTDTEVGLAGAGSAPPLVPSYET